MLSKGIGNGNPLQYSCLENPVDRGAWWATIHGAAKNQTRLKRMKHTHTMINRTKLCPKANENEGRINLTYSHIFLELAC